jgi:hypothetical protein
LFEEETMRTLYWLSPCLLILGIATVQAAEERTSTTQSYCINKNADFYPYKQGENCKKGYQLAPGNCRLPTGKIVAAVKNECLSMTGTVELPFPPVLLRQEVGKPDDPVPEPLKPPPLKE